MKARRWKLAILLAAPACFDSKKEEAMDQHEADFQYAICQANAAVKADEAAERMGLSLPEFKCVSVTWFGQCVSKRYQDAYQRPMSEENQRALDAAISRECLARGGRTKRVAELLDGAAR
jgi:hypothetical protein